MSEIRQSKYEMILIMAKQEESSLEAWWSVVQRRIGTLDFVINDGRTFFSAFVQQVFADDDCCYASTADVLLRTPEQQTILEKKQAFRDDH